MMKLVIRLTLVILILSPFNLRAQTLSVPPGISNETIEDFLKLLKTSTGDNWKISNENKGKRILLQLKNDPRFITKESYHLTSNGKDQLTISSSSPEGLIFGFYQHLRNLGFKFYLPDELYTIIPKLQHPFGAPKDAVGKPFLEIRNFFGTGGFGSSQADPQRDAEKQWNLWKQRNGFGGAYHISGHRGEDFILSNYELLKSKPHWLVRPLSGNKHADLGIKLNYLNKEALDFYVNWSLKEVIQPGFTPPPPNHLYYISMEPSDGSNYLNELPENAGRNLPSISDQVYRAANLAGEKLDKLFPNHPNIRVNVFAYSSHAAPPSFPLHKRVLVQLIPYSFQNIAFGPSFIRLWKPKLKNFLLYDYFRYTDSQMDVPGGMSLEETMKRLVHSTKMGSDGILYETSYSKFATGIPLWILAQYLTKGDANWKQNLEQLNKDLYEKAMAPMTELFGLFYNEPNYGVQHFGNSIHLVQRALAAEKDPLVQKRLDEMKLYLNYIHLVYQSRDLKNGNLYQRTLPLAEFAWKLHPTRIIHAYRVMQIVSYEYLNVNRSEKEYAKYQQLHLDWFPDTERSKTAWNRIPQKFSAADFDINRLTKHYPVAALPAPYTMKQVMTALDAQPLEPIRRYVFGGDQLVRGYLGVYSDRPVTLKIRYQIRAAQPDVRISAVDDAYTFDTAFLLNKSQGEFSLTLPAGETTVFLNAGEGNVYRMEAGINKGFFFFDGSPRGKLAFYKNISDPIHQYTYEPLYYPSYFFVPKRTEVVQYKVQLNAATISTPAGKKILPELLFTEHAGVENRRFRVDARDAGKVWKLEAGGNYNYTLQSIPDRYLMLKEK